MLKNGGSNFQRKIIALFGKIINTGIIAGMKNIYYNINI
jgi:hypothetical protein